jgi:DNA-binding NarL/FixJ family response regulator
MNSRLLIIGAERELRLWLRHQVEVLWPDAKVEEMEPAQLEGRAQTLRMRELQLILLCVQCEGSAEDASAGLDPLRQLLRYNDVPPTVVIASDGNELTAVRAIRLGANDYLPRELINGQRLATTLRTALRAPRRSPAARLRPAKSARRRIDAAHLNLPQYSISHKLGESAGTQCGAQDQQTYYRRFGRMQRVRSGICCDLGRASSGRGRDLRLRLS